MLWRYFNFGKLSLQWHISLDASRMYSNGSLEFSWTLILVVKNVLFTDVRVESFPNILSLRAFFCSHVMQCCKSAMKHWLRSRREHPLHRRSPMCVVQSVSPLAIGKWHCMHLFCKKLIFSLYSSKHNALRLIRYLSDLISTLPWLWPLIYKILDIYFYLEKQY